MACPGGFDLSGFLPILLAILDIILTIIGLIPAPVPIAGQVGLGADLTTVVLNVLSDEPILAALSVVALVPIAGQFSGTLKIIYRVTQILTFFLNSPLIQFAIVGSVLGGIFLLYYFIYYI